jgi:hypothetical protein
LSILLSDTAEELGQYISYACKKIEAGDRMEEKIVSSIIRYPVSIREFITSPKYLDQGNSIYPLVLDELEKLNNPVVPGLAHGMRIGSPFTEAVFTGGIGVGKSHCALITTAYQLYILSCLEEPQQIFDLDPSSEILFVFQTLNLALAKKLDYGRFKEMMDRSPYFNEVFPYDKKVESELLFPNRIIVRPVSGQETATIGQNVFGGVLDEVNFMENTQSSSKTPDGSTYDQAIALYNSIASRRKSRFLKMGRLFGMLCVVSSKRYPNQFTDQKVAQAKKELGEKGKTSIYVYDKTRWEIKPDDFCGKKFRVFKGDQNRKPRILTQEEAVEGTMVLEVPIEYQSDFENDIMGSLRDIGSVSTLARHPFIPNTERIAEAFGQAVSILNVEGSDFAHSSVKIYPNHIYHPKEARFIHVDLALTGDSAGIVCGYVSAFPKLNRGSNVIEVLPEITVDFALEIYPPKSGEIDIARIRKMIIMLRDKMKMNVRWVTYDQFQSADSIQTLRQNGFTTGLRSMDRTPIPYETLKQAIYDGRVKIPSHDKLQKELIELEFDARKNKIDHPPNSSKDISDCLAGVVYGLTMRRETWARWGVLSHTFEEQIRKEESKLKSVEGAA